MDWHMEVCDTQAVFSLLKTGSVACSETFALDGALEAVNYYAKRELYAQRKKSTNLTNQDNKEEEDPALGTTREDQVTDDDSLDRGEENDETMLDSEDMGSGTELPNSEDVSINLALIRDYFGKAALYNVIVDKEKGTPSAKIPFAFETHFQF